MLTINYTNLNVGAFFIYKKELCKKLEPMPPVIPVAYNVVREATMTDAEMYHILEELK